jgi:hypothetical protein
MFKLTPAGGAIGTYAAAVKTCHEDFLALARRIAASAGMTIN